MDFFASQARARRHTRVLIVLFASAVLVVAVLTNLALIVASRLIDPVGFSGMGSFNPETFACVTVFVAMVICAGSVIRIISLRSGGAAVAETLAGKLVVAGQLDPLRQRLLNVVEEMAIASGTPVPQVYILPDEAINAFAAGYEPGDAVIVVTEGTLKQLNRDQLQGVVAHEFSHILNGDMRLNMHMIGVLYGIYMLSVVGRILAGGSESSSRTRVTGRFYLVGLMLFVVGALGPFLGGLIKAALSRQREFLADASAVQFTRNPQGIAGALKRIGGATPGASIDGPHSLEIGHALFAQGSGGALLAWPGGESRPAHGQRRGSLITHPSRLLATHPPLDERIRRLDPGWDGGYFPEVSQETQQSVSMLAPSPSPSLSASQSTSTRQAPEPLDAIGQSAGPDETRRLMARLPGLLASGVHDPFQARSVIYLLLLDADGTIREQQINHIRASDPHTADALVLLMDSFPVGPESKLALIEMAIPALRQLSSRQYLQFRDDIDALIRANRRISMTEWSLKKYITGTLDPIFGRERRRRAHRRIEECQTACSVLLSMLAFGGRQRNLLPEQAFAAGCVWLPIRIGLMPRESVSLKALDEAVNRLAELKPLRKPRLLKACVATILADGAVTHIEIMLIRSVAAALDCPMPPLVARTVH